MTITAKPEMLRAGAVVSDNRIGVDRDQKAILGYVVAEVGDFKDRRGSFDRSSLSRIVELGNARPAGLRSRLSHPNASDDGLTKHLGRSKNFRLSDDGDQVRADLFLADVSMGEPVGGGKPIGQYVMDLAEEDPGALSSSLVLKSTKTARTGQDGKGLPSHWMPEELRASDIVADGDAVHGDLLSEEGLDEFFEGSVRRLPTKAAIAASDYLNQLFPESDRATIESRFDAFRDRYLDRRFPSAGILDTDEESSMDQETKDALAETDKKIEGLVKSTDEKLSTLTELITQDRDERKKELSAKDRAAEINALCEMSGVAEKGEASKWISDDKLSADDVRKTLFERKCSKSPPVGDDTEGEGTGEGLSSKPKDEDAGYLKDFEEQLDELQRDGITKEQYVNWRRRKDNLPVHETTAA